MTQEELNEVVSKSDDRLKPTNEGRRQVEWIADQLVKMGIPPTDNNIVRYLRAYGR